VLALQQLQHLSVTLELPASDQAQVLQLAQLPALQELQLVYTDLAAAAAAAPSWVLLPQLQQLSLQFKVRYIYTSPVHRQHLAAVLAAVLAGVAAATQLAGLLLLLFSDQTSLSRQERARALPICSSLAGLTGLKGLGFHQVGLLPGDVQALTVLTGLTRLELSDLQDGVDTAAAAVLATSVQNLQHLSIVGCSFDYSTPRLLAAVGQLTQLTQLTELRLTLCSALSAVSTPADRAEAARVFEGRFE
jgi:hypothetical protein